MKRFTEGSIHTIITTMSDKENTISKSSSWSETILAFTKPSVYSMLFLGFSAGLPIMLIFSSLSLWLGEAGVSRSTVTFFSWAALGYSFKFIWSPLVDGFPLPWFTKKMGRRRSWLLFSQILIIFSILGMAFVDPSSAAVNLKWMALAAVGLGFSSATQDIVIDAFRIESDSKEMQALLSSTYIAGYRIGMIVSGAGALFIARSLGSFKGNYNYNAWMWTYIFMALFMLIGVVTTFLIKEPEVKSRLSQKFKNSDYLYFLGLFVIVVLFFILSFYVSSQYTKELKQMGASIIGKGLSSLLVESLRLGLALCVSVIVAKVMLKFNIVNTKMVTETYIAPVEDFFKRYGTSTALILLSLVGLYRISDIVLGVISNVFYQDLGFTKVQIGMVVKTNGLIMTILGGFLGGILSVRYGVMKVLFAGGVLSAATNLLFMWLAYVGKDMTLFYAVVSADNLCAGIASAAFVAFLSSLTNISFTAVQYAIFSSLMTLLPKVMGGYSGTIVDSIGYQGFFLFTTLVGVPVLFIIYFANKKLELRK